MTINEAVQAEKQETSINQEETNQPTLKDLQDQFLKTQEDFQRKEAEYKKMISGLDRKVTESEKLIQQKELEKLNEVEREKALTEIAKQERLKEQELTESLKRERIIDRTLIGAGIPVEFAKRISGKDESEIQEDVKEFNAYIEKLVNSRVEKTINEKLSGKPPIIGVPVDIKVVTSAQWLTMNPREQEKFINSGGQIKD